MTPRENTNRKDDVMARSKTAVRTTIEPGVVLKVDDAELLDLERSGLIKSREGDEGWQPEETDEAPAAPAEKATKAETKKGA